MNREKYKVERAIKKLGLQLSPEHLTRIENEFYKTGPLESLMDDATITEIIVNGPTKIYYEHQGRLHLHPDSFLNVYKATRPKINENLKKKEHPQCKIIFQVAGFLSRFFASTNLYLKTFIPGVQYI
jgi:hypothetical protein